MRAKKAIRYVTVCTEPRGRKPGKNYRLDLKSLPAGGQLEKGGPLWVFVGKKNGDECGIMIVEPGVKAVILEYASAGKK